MFFAHSTDRPDRSDWQPLAVHLTGVGAKASEFAAKFGAPKAALLAGLAHDLGKYSLAFQARLSGGKERVDHSTAGAREVVGATLPKAPWSWMAELVAYAIAGHHAGLPDRHGGRGSLEERLKAASIPEPDPAWAGEISLPAAGPPRIPDPVKERYPFQLAFLGRMIFSALVDADRRDTEEHAVATGQEEAKPRDRPLLSEQVDAMIARLDAHLARLSGRAPDDTLTGIRRRVLDAVTARAEGERGLYTLTVPTGGGKTLTATRFALGHARRWHLDRIIYAIPFTSVIEQTAAILKGIFGEELVLEHHSAIEFGSSEDERQFRERDESLGLKLRLAMEDWAVPVVVTTNVQLFESLFSHRPSRCRKLHNLANSVIILDEAQTIPLMKLRPCLAAIDELARNYGCTVVLCTATQPAIAAPDFGGGLHLGPERELAPDPAGLHEELRRAAIRIEPRPMTDGDLVAALASVEQGFVILNSRRHALAVYRAARQAGLEGLIHLSTRQYAAHRREIIAGIKRDLADGRPCRLVATSLIEAGIDLDFRAGWRAMAGLESIVQSAGRVNREGRYAAEDSILTVFTPAVDQDTPREIAGFIRDLGRMAREHSDLAHPDAIRAYFREVYFRTDAELDIIEVREDNGATRRSVLDSFRLSGSETNFAYRTVGENFRMVEDQGLPVIVARDEEASIALDRLGRPDASAGAAARLLQRYIVQVPQRSRQRMLDRGDVQFREHARFGEQFPVLAADLLYQDEFGLLWEDDAELGSEDTIF
ncbi:CRISPR-associated helicase Cas3' [Enterovirga aerilata]|uniref:CRISPR-associated helicase Cas3 n=1 Tax=Enterovirga aerilata TaxID=2730920 RepID=A0A849I1Q4_9HYPH|nr:CRISPR-associated helicase Cas3' [Enterovirga sp. DB1703]NNM71291.1 CRISPR-associated helicase Cas3' [Enterovirga sp. DB1703]